MRWAAVLLLLVSVSYGGPFDPPAADAFGNEAAPGVLARYAESLALLGETLAGDPADIAAWRRAADLLGIFSRAAELTPLVRKQLEKQHALAAKTALGGVLGHLLVVEARDFGFNGIIIIGPGFRQRQPAQLPDRAKKLYDEAVSLLAPALAPALAPDPGSIDLREDLAEALERLDATANADEVKRLRVEAGALRLRARLASGGAARPKPVDRMPEVERLRAEAIELEQEPEDPDHGAALILRQRALVLEFGTHTIPFEYEPTIFEAVSLLAPARLVDANLTRTYTANDGKRKSVPPQYYPATTARKLELVAGLAVNPSDAAGAALLAVVRREEPDAPVVAAAIEGLGRGNHPGVRTRFPALLDTILLDDNASYSRGAQRLLVRLAARWKLEEAAPVLARYLADDSDLASPLDLAWALGEVGGPEHVAALRALATDPARDVWFRRQAVVAIGKLSPEALAELPDEPRIGLALAAARYRAAPGDDLRGRILTAIGQTHETDDAARYCVELDIREAIPGLEAFLARNANHYAAQDIRASLEALQRRGRR